MNIAIITQARTTSSRLPEKILLTAKKISLLKHHILRLKQSELPVIVATTTNQGDNAIINICKRNSIPYYRGNENDVLSRFYECALENNIEIIIRVTSDCPLIDAQLILEGLKKYLSIYEMGKKVYLSNTLIRTFPKGMDFEIFSFDMLKEAFNNAILKIEREHVTPYFYQGKDKTIELINFSNERNTSNIRITLDYKRDYFFIKTLIEKYNAHLLPNKSIEDIVLGCKELMKLNNLCIQTAQLIN